ncbi:hypothetical protein [Leucobacter sp. M11]|uniref:hypothetical protein n=1 Tax=Leucobacter sp. M11 TaxID=2993565 RepID=UPI002D807B51|nr:hypothetical protein [Leucobacter sp. M11]MEB4614131.1 hypothetical protein [Leucobacter sp. M11]
MSADTPTATRFERVLAYLIVTVMALAVISFLFVLVTAWVSGVDSTIYDAWYWPAVTFISMYGLPVGFVLIVILLITSMSRRKKANRQDATG